MAAVEADVFRKALSLSVTHLIRRLEKHKSGWCSEQQDKSGQAGPYQDKQGEVEP